VSRVFKGVEGNLDGVVCNFDGVIVFDLEVGDLDGIDCCLVGVFLYGDFSFLAGDLGCFSVTSESVAVN